MILKKNASSARIARLGGKWYNMRQMKRAESDRAIALSASKPAGLLVERTTLTMEFHRIHHLGMVYYERRNAYGMCGGCVTGEVFGCMPHSARVYVAARKRKQLCSQV